MVVSPVLGTWPGWQNAPVTQIVSIQSQVSFGFVGNSAATFALRRMGIDVWPVPTVSLSNHNGYPSVHGVRFAPGQVEDLVTGLDELGLLCDVDALLTGYLGDVAMGEEVLRAVRLVQARNPSALVCCDPVMGERTGGLYCPPQLPAFFAERLVPRARVVTPNLFELETLTATATSSVSEVVAAAQRLRASGPSTVLVTSVEANDVPADVVAMIAVDGEGAWYVETPRQPRTFSGSGDLTTAVLLGQLLGGHDLPDALGFTASAVHGVLSGTTRTGRRELELVAAQDELEHPSRRFTAVRIDG